jgi:3,4-dihydroxy 2-butanone 4-phosphate synthase/GTP cyclohydrolase II
MRDIAEEGRGVIVLIREPLTVVLAEQRRRAGEPIPPAAASCATTASAPRS